jgi:hypothetical protein
VHQFDPFKSTIAAVQFLATGQIVSSLSLILSRVSSLTQSSLILPSLIQLSSLTLPSLIRLDTTDAAITDLIVADPIVTDLAIADLCHR